MCMYRLLIISLFYYLGKLKILLAICYAIYLLHMLYIYFIVVIYLLNTNE